MVKTHTGFQKQQQTRSTFEGFTSGYEKKQAKVEQKQKATVVSQENAKITLSNYQAGVPTVEDVRTTFPDFNAQNNVFMNFAQAEIKRIQQEDPTFFNDANISTSGISMINLAYYFMMIAGAYLKKVKALSGPGANDPNLLEPDGDAPVPHGLAKLLEYCAPFRDKNTNCEYQPRIPCAAWPTYGTALYDQINVPSSTVPIYLQSESNFRRAFPVTSGTFSTYNLTAPLAQNISLTSITSNIDVIYSALSNMKGYCRYREIAVNAPDCSANCLINVYNTGQIIGPSRFFDPDVAVLFGNVGYSYGFFYAKPFNVPMVVNSPGVFPGSGVLTNGSANLDMWAYQLANCGKYRQGVYNLTLISSIYAGRKGLRTYVGNIVGGDGTGLRQVVNGILENWDQQGVPFDAAFQGLNSFWIVTITQVIARIGRYHHLTGMWWQSNTNDLTGYAPAALKISTHPLVAEYLTALAPIAVDGIVFFPVYIDNYNNGQVMAKYLAQLWFGNGPDEELRFPLLATNGTGAAMTQIGNLLVANISNNAAFGLFDAHVAQIDPAWLTVAPFNSIATDIWIPPHETALGDPSMFCLWNVRGAYKIPAINANLWAKLGTFTRYAVVQLNNIFPLTVGQCERAMRRALCTQTSGFVINNLTTTTPLFQVNGVNGQNNISDCAQRIQIVEKPAVNTELSRYLDLPQTKAAVGVARGDELVTGKKFNNIQIVDKLVSEFSKDSATARYAGKTRISIPPIWGKSMFSTLYNSAPGKIAMNMIREHGPTVLRKAVAAGLGGGYGSLMEGLLSIAMNTGAPMKLLKDATPRIKIEEMDD